MNYNTAEYQRSNAAVTSGAITAWNKGYTGQGIKVGVVDSGINPTLGEFTGRIDAASRDVTTGGRALSDEDGHGTAVAGVIAAARNDALSMGVAFNSTIVALKADQPGTCSSDCNFLDTDIARGVDAARVAGAKVINLSLGGGSMSQTMLSALGKAVQAGIVVVISAGNDGEDPAKSPNPDAFAVSGAQRYPGQVIIAGALNATNSDIASFSNRAGTGAQWYLMALGTNVRTIDQNGAASNWSGTSFSAPVISGSAALLAQAFPNLSGAEIIQILFTTADDLGAPGVDSTYGHGRLNLTRAFQPIGQLSLAGSKQIVDTNASIGETPAAAGDASQQGTLGAIVLDGYSRAYTVNLAKRLQASTPRTHLAEKLGQQVQTGHVANGPLSVTFSLTKRQALVGADLNAQQQNQARLVATTAVARLNTRTRLAFGLSQSASDLGRQLRNAERRAFLVASDTAGTLGFQSHRSNAMAVGRDVGRTHLSLAAESGRIDNRQGDTRAYRMTSAGLSRNFGMTTGALTFTYLGESNSVLGARTTGLINSNGAKSYFAGADLDRKIGTNLSVRLNAKRGWTSFASGRFQTSAYGLDLVRDNLFSTGDSLMLRVSQPLRVEKGGYALTLPTDYDYATGVATNSRQAFSLSPSGREIDAELGYGMRLGNGWFSANLFGRRQPGHVAAAKPDVGGAIRYGVSF